MANKHDLAISTSPAALTAGSQKPPAETHENQPRSGEVLPPGASNELSLMPNRGSLVVADEDFESGVTGLENVTAKDLLIPRITIIQKISPQLDKQRLEYIEGAHEGQFCDVGTGEVFDDLLVLPVFYARIFLEWAPRRTQKGIVKDHGTDGSILAQCKPDDKKRMILPNGNLIAETAQFYCLNLMANSRRSFIPMASTQLKAGRAWLTRVTSERLLRSNPKPGESLEFQPPLFYRAWAATTRVASNAEGSWHMWHMEPGPTVLQLDPTKTLLKDAKEFAMQAAQGIVKGDITEEDLRGNTGGARDNAEGAM